MLGQAFGLTIFAVSTVLTAFMAGLALGSYFFGRLIDKVKDPLFIFLLLELGIGVFALLFPILLKLLAGMYISLASLIQPGLYINSILRFVFSFLLLLIPTTLMGGTLPVLSKYYIKNLSRLGGNVGNLYSINNLGAVAGCFIASFFLIQAAGLSCTIYSAALINILIAGVVFIIRGKTPIFIISEDKKAVAVKKRNPGQPETCPPFLLRLVLWVFAIEGFTTLSYEVIWTRILLGISYDRSIYFYSTVIIAFISGLSLGSFIIARFVDKRKNLVFLLGAIEVMIGIIACTVLFFFVQISGYFSTARRFYTEPWLFSSGKEYLFFFLLMIIPATLMGMTFPIVARIYTTNIEKLGLKLGIIGFLDTIGSIFGSFAAGFILIPFLGVVKAALFTALLNVLIGIALIIFHPHLKTKIKVLSVIITAAAMVFMVAILPGENYFRHWQTEEKGDRLLFYKEGLGSTVAVPEKFDGVRELAIDGAVTAIAEYGDIRVHKLLAYLPYLLCEKPGNALVVGFGMGITCQSLIQEDMKEVTCVEICTEIIDGSSGYFKKENKKVLNEPTLKVVIEDGRSYMAMTDDTYDIITTNAVHPRLSINIYTKEFYQLCKRKLTKQGVMCQWMATNWLSEYEYRMLIKSFIDVFPHTSLWISNIGHILILGTPGPLQIDFNRFMYKLNRPKIRNDLKEVHLDDPFSLLALYTCGKDELENYLKDIPPNSDNYPLPEFSKYMSTTPNLKIIDEILTYPRDANSIMVNMPSPDDREKLKQYVDAEVYFLKARYTYFQSPEGDTTENLSMAARLNPYNFSFHKALGDRYSETGNFEKAVEQYKTGIDLDKDNPLGYLDLAYAYFKTGNHASACTLLDKVFELEPENGLAHYLLSVIYRLDSRFKEAARELEIVTDHFPSFKNAFFELGETYFAMGNYKQAKEEFIRFAEKEKNNKEVQYLFKELKRLGY